MWRRGKRAGCVNVTSASSCDFSELRTTAVKGRGLERRSYVGAQKWRGKGLGGGEDVGGAGVSIKIDLLQH